VLGQQPRQGDLGVGGALAGRDRRQQVDRSLVGAARLFGEPGKGVAQVTAIERGRGDRTGEEALAQRAEGYESDAQLD
jgi:hypothetical protein